jgi:predicted metal-dependent HD superfamily phosphohydrolase
MTDPLAPLPEGLCLPAELRASLREAYASPPRAYHHFGHVLEVAASYREVAQEVGWEQPREVFLAVLYHDAVYEAGRKDNEARSAQEARRAIARWLSNQDLDAARVVALIELTARHGKLTPDDVGRDEALFLDCDMAILGATPTRFDAYETAIAEEYAAVPRPMYLSGRRAFLQRVLEKPRIFLSPFFHERLDARARSNLRRALEALASDRP